MMLEHHQKMLKLTKKNFLIQCLHLFFQHTIYRSKTSKITLILDSLIANFRTGVASFATWNIYSAIVSALFFLQNMLLMFLSS